MVDELYTDLVQAVIRDQSRRQSAVVRFLDEFSAHVPASAADRGLRMADTARRLDRALDGLQVVFANSRPVIKGNSAVEQLLKELRHGGAWHLPWEDAEIVLLAVLLSETSV